MFKQLHLVSRQNKRSRLTPVSQKQSTGTCHTLGRSSKTLRPRVSFSSECSANVCCTTPWAQSLLDSAHAQHQPGCSHNRLHCSVDGCYQFCARIAPNSL